MSELPSQSVAVAVVVGAALGVAAGSAVAVVVLVAVSVFVAVATSWFSASGQAAEAAVVAAHRSYQLYLFTEASTDVVQGDFALAG